MTKNDKSLKPFFVLWTGQPACPVCVDLVADADNWFGDDAGVGFTGWDAAHAAEGGRRPFPNTIGDGRS